MSYIDQNLMPGERITHKTKLHWAIFIWPLIFFVISFVNPISMPFELWSLPFLLLAFITGIPSLMKYFTSEFGVTNRRVIVKVGLIRKRSLEILLNKIESIGVDQTLAGRIFGYGSILVTGTGGTHEPFKKVMAPYEFRRHVQEQIPSNKNT